jgi:acyl-CoA reductase-like NAD-dependent aldehyde dehydrogenase
LVAAHSLQSRTDSLSAWRDARVAERGDGGCARDLWGVYEGGGWEVVASVDRLIYYAGWSDKYEQVLGNTNPVAGPFFNFTVAEPMGIIGIIADDAFPLLGLLSQIAPVVIAGNTCVCLASQEFPYPAIVLGELPLFRSSGGVVVSAGFRGRNSFPLSRPTRTSAASTPS